jgi:hypothetical protein
MKRTEMKTNPYSFRIINFTRKIILYYGIETKPGPRKKKEQRNS